MAHPWDPVQIGLDDPACAGVTDPANRIRYDAQDHVVTLPRYEAERILRSGPIASRRRGGIAVRRPVLEAHVAYDAYCATHPWLPYMQWYREHWRKEEPPDGLA
jgi:hypothetical protein